MEVNQTRIFFHSCSLNISGNLWAIFRCWKGGLISMHVHQKKSIIDLIFYDSQNLFPLFSVHYIVNTDISLSFRDILQRFFDLQFTSGICSFLTPAIFYPPEVELLECSPMGSHLSLFLFNIFP